MVANFVRDNKICQCGISKRLLSDNDISFFTMHVGRILNDYELIMRSQVPIILKEPVKQGPPIILALFFSKMVYEKPKR